METGLSSRPLAFRPANGRLPVRQARIHYRGLGGREGQHCDGHIEMSTISATGETLTNSWRISRSVGVFCGDSEPLLEVLVRARAIMRRVHRVQFAV